jgi:hypothetical protein
MIEKRVWWRLFIIIISATIIVSVLALSVQAQTMTSGSESKKLQGFMVVHIGRDNNLSTQVVDSVKYLGAQAILSHEIPESAELNERLIVVFDGEWIKEKAHDAELHNFLRNAASRGSRLVAMGGATSKFFEALDEAGVDRLIVTETGETRNPAHDNPPIVGFRMKRADGYTYPSILISYASDANGLMEALIGWSRAE